MDKLCPWHRYEHDDGAVYPAYCTYDGEVRVGILMDMVVEGSVTFEDFAKAISFRDVDEDYKEYTMV